MVNTVLLVRFRKITKVSPRNPSGYGESDRNAMIYRVFLLKVLILVVFTKFNKSRMFRMPRFF